MWNRRSRAEWERNKGEGNRLAFRRVVSSEAPTGVLAYDGKEPVGWCAIAPREHYPTLARSRVLKPIDSQPVWAVTCFFIRRDYRHKGLSTALLRAAVDFARKKGARIVEGYPLDPRPDKIMAMLAWAWSGLPETFLRAGFKEVARGSPTRPIMRYQIAR